MKFGQVLGRVVCTQKLSYFNGLPLLLVQPLNEQQQPAGDALIAFDTVQAGPGDLIFYETSKEAGWAARQWYTPADAATLGMIDQLHTGTEHA